MRYNEKMKLKREHREQMSELHLKLLENYNKKIKNEGDDKVFRIPSPFNDVELNKIDK